MAMLLTYPRPGALPHYRAQSLPGRRAHARGDVPALSAAIDGRERPLLVAA